MPFWKCLEKKKKLPVDLFFGKSTASGKYVLLFVWSCLGWFVFGVFFFTISKQKPSHLPDRNTGETRTFTAFSFVAVIFTVFWRKLWTLAPRFGANLTTLIYRFTFAFAFPFTDLILFNLSCYWAFCFIAFNFITIINTLPSVRWHFTACWFVK